MTTYNTGNPVPSADARDRFDNSQTFDEVINGGLTFYKNRVGNNILSLKGMADLFNAAQENRTTQFNTYLAATGFENPPIQYFDGTPVTIDRPTQLVTRGGNLYSVRMPATFPYALTGNWTTDQTHLVLRNDQSLRQDFAAVTGDTLVGSTLPNSQPGTVHDYLVMLEKRTAKGIWDYAHLVTSRPTPSNPETWLWTPAFQASANTGEAVTAPDQLFICGQVDYAAGWRLYGAGGGRFMLETARTVIRSLNAGEYLFRSKNSTFTGQREGGSLFDVRLESDFPFQCGDYNTQVILNGTSPYEMRSFIQRCSFAPITSATGDGIVLVKCFDHIIEGNDITGFSRGIVELGCDIGAIRNNRIINFALFGLLQLSTATFGSETDVSDNEFLGGGVNSVYYKTTSRHVRGNNNYFERSGAVTVKGFFDASAQPDDPVLGPNPVSTSRLESVSFTLMRNDSKAKASLFVNRFEPVGFFAEITDVGTSGPASTLSWLTIVGDELPLFNNSANSCSFSFKGGSQIVDTWRTFSQGPITYSGGSIGFNNRNILDLDNSELKRNNAYQNVRLIERGIVLKTALGATMFHCIFRGSEGVNNPNLRDTIVYNVKIIARARVGSGSLSVLKIVNAAQQGSTITTALTNQAQVISTTITGAASTAKIGLAFHVTGSFSDVIIERVDFTPV